MSQGAALAAAVLLSAERVCYVWIARAPDAFRAWCARPIVARVGEPVAVVRALFYGFKLLQVAVFLGWCYLHGNGSLAPTTRHGIILGLASAAIVVGQVLNLGAFYRLGRVGAFFGDRLGHDVRWCRDFPFSLLAHPQYVGTVLTIWGIFAVMRFPGEDWYVLPVLETVYYVVGGYLEDQGQSVSQRAGVPATSRRR
jgi:methylene-fatty-acyl-phospholipid synthase